MGIFGQSIIIINFRSTTQWPPCHFQGGQSAAQRSNLRESPRPRHAPFGTSPEMCTEPLSTDIPCADLSLGLDEERVHFRVVLANQYIHIYIVSGGSIIIYFSQNYTTNCIFGDLVGVGDLKMPPVGGQSTHLHLQMKAGIVHCQARANLR